MGNSSCQSIPIIKLVCLFMSSGRFIIVFSSLDLTNCVTWSATHLLLHECWGGWTPGVSEGRVVEWKQWPHWEFPLKIKSSAWLFVQRFI